MVMGYVLVVVVVTEMYTFVPNPRAQMGGPLGHDAKSQVRWRKISTVRSHSHMDSKQTNQLVGSYQTHGCQAEVRMGRWDIRQRGSKGANFQLAVPGTGCTARRL